MIAARMRQFKAQITRNSSAIAKICNEEMAHSGGKVKIHDLTRDP
jgi:hypothetical protein